MINLKNYEAYFLDYIEGNLSPEDIDMLLLFLDKHPDLKDELESFDTISLSPTPINFDKSALKQVDLVDDNINSENFEEFAIANFENELIDEKENELNYFISQNPEFKKEITLISKTKLKADESIVYNEKENLKKTIPFIIPYYRLVGIAAILLLMFYFFIPKNDKSENFVALKTVNENIKNNNSIKDVLDNSNNKKEIESSNVAIDKFSTNNHQSEENNYSSSFNSKNNIELNYKDENANSTESLKESINPIKNLTKELVPSISEKRLVASALDIKNVKPYYEETNISTANLSTDDDFLTPKEFLTSLFKKKVLKSDNYDPELEIDDFNNALVSATNDKISFKKASNEARYLSIHTKNFSFEKKISE